MVLIPKIIFLIRTNGLDFIREREREREREVVHCELGTEILNKG